MLWHYHVCLIRCLLNSLVIDHFFFRQKLRLTPNWKRGFQVLPHRSKMCYFKLPIDSIIIFMMQVTPNNLKISPSLRSANIFFLIFCPQQVENLSHLFCDSYFPAPLISFKWESSFLPFICFASTDVSYLKNMDMVSGKIYISTLLFDKSSQS